MTDARRGPEISPPSVFLALLHAFVFRLPSFQPLEEAFVEEGGQRIFDTIPTPFTATSA